MKITLSKSQWEAIGRTAGWMGSKTPSKPLLPQILEYSKANIVNAIKRLGEESIAGFSSVTEDDVDDILAMQEEYALAEILETLKKTKK